MGAETARSAERARVAVLGDLHGHLTLAYTLLRRWEVEHGESIALILQVGDLGAFPTTDRLDRATLRFARKDPDELEFMDYHEGRGDAAEILDPVSESPRRIDARTCFVKWNHEDFEFLEEAGGSRAPAPVDAFRRIFYMPGGSGHAVGVGRGTLSVETLGGAALEGGPGRDGASPHYTGREARSLAAKRCDVFLTHDAPYGAVHPGAGSRDVLRPIELMRPRYHFCGHYHEEGRRLDAPDGTESHLLNEVNSHGRSRLNRGCIGMLTWGGGAAGSFELLDEPWMAGYTRESYRRPSP